MAAIPSAGDSTNSTTCEWTCTNRDCRNCTASCAYVFYYGGTTAITIPRRLTSARSDDVYTETGMQKLIKELKDKMPEKQPNQYLLGIWMMRREDCGENYRDIE